MLRSSGQHWRALKGTPFAAPAELRARFGQNTPPIDPYAIAAGLGVDVRHTGERSWSGAVKFDDEHAVIWLNERDGRRRQRFTVAHELGHLMLHRGGAGMFRDSTFSGGQEESQANEFAAELLMPADLLQHWAPVVGGDQARLAQLFDVSLEALQVRLSKLARRQAWSFAP